MSDWGYWSITARPGLVFPDWNDFTRICQDCGVEMQHVPRNKKRCDGCNVTATNERRLRKARARREKARRA